LPRDYNGEDQSSQIERYYNDLVSTHIYIYILPSLILPLPFSTAVLGSLLIQKNKSVVVEFMILLCLLATKLEFVSFFTMAYTMYTIGT